MTSLGEGEFVVLVDGELRRYGHMREIPERFDNIIKFAPSIPPGPHTAEQHAAIDALNDEFQRLMEVERARSNAHRRR